MKPANSETILGEFNDKKFTLDGVDYYFFKSAGEYRVRIREINKIETTYTIAYTFGVEPLQQYLIPFPKGQYQVLRASWDTEGKTWFHQYAGSTIDPKDWLHWTNGAQRWNTMCAECHSTDLKKNYNPKSKAFKTTFSEINVGCESCHGMGKKHISWANGEYGADDPKNYIQRIGNSQVKQVNTCGPCHSRRVKITADMIPGKPFEDQFILQSLDEEYYHPDGQIDEEDYVLGSFVQSRMFHEDVKCSDCHEPHSLKLVAIGNELCYSCHESSYGEKSHHFHSLESTGSECVSCHMTGKVYMGNDFRRDHSFRIPRPDQSISHGTPNACNSCHENKTPTWAAEQIDKWYGPERKSSSSDALLLSSMESVSEEEAMEIAGFIQNNKVPVIIRGTMIGNIPRGRNYEEMTAIINSLKDSAAYIRFQALNYCRDFPQNDRIAIAVELLQDKAKIVRIGAAQLIADVDPNIFPKKAYPDWEKAKLEWEEMLGANADFPLGRLNLGDYYFQEGDIPSAINQYETALEMDSQLTQVHSNLATAYNLAGQNVKALVTLNNLLILEPEYARGYYLRALLLNEIQDSEGAIRDLDLAIQYDPDAYRYYYNLSFILFNQGDYSRAKKILEKGLEIQPSDPDGTQLMARIVMALTS